MKQAIQKGAVIEEEMAEVLTNGKNAMPVYDIDKFKGHGSSAPHGVQIAAGRTEAAVTGEGNKF